MKEFRIGIIGMGGMGRSHAKNILGGEVPRCRLTAVCDAQAASLPPYDGVEVFSDAQALFASGLVDGVLIATPHYSHTSIGIAALKAGLHVLVEKPISVHKEDCEQLIAAHQSKKQVFAAMFNMRTDPSYLKLREMIQGGELGTIRRINWIVTTWFRTAAYYGSGGWRATWAGEGGGVLLNQCPHQLDLWQWLFGMPDKVRAHCQFGRYHNIEVEDDVTAYMEYANGTTGVFITSTGEAPGTDRLEVAGERGRVVLENSRLLFTRNEVEMSEFSRTTKAVWARPPVWNVEVPISGPGLGHVGIIRNFTEAVLDKTALIAPAAEGIHSVELGNAMLLSAFQDKTVTLPMDGRTFARELKKRSTKKNVSKSKPLKKTASSSR